MYAPIIIFAFNRLDSLKATVASLLMNEEAGESDLFVYVDGARKYKLGEQEKVQAVQGFVKSISGFKSIKYFFSEQNKGLGTSIIHGVSEVINQYDKAIVLEDDLIVSTNFLSFMNQGLDKYEKEEKVFSICGYTNKIKVPKSYPYDAYFCTRSSSWGWGTWKDRWESIDWELKDWNRYSRLGKAFNRWGGSDCYKMLHDWKKGKNQSWAIRFCFAQFLQDRLSLFPLISKVKNDGFNGDGTNCKKWSRFKCIFDGSGQQTFRYPEAIVVEPHLYHSAMSYNSIGIRIWSKIMYILHP